MKPLTEEWVTTAEGDYVSAKREVSAQEDPNYDSAFFHAQQCAEKYLKAMLCEANIAVPKMHDLNLLVDLLPVLGEFAQMHEALEELTAGAVESRYPGFFADTNDAREAVEVAGRVRALARKALAAQD